MNSFPEYSAEVRALMLAEAAAVTGLPGRILEKDFWVCWILDVLFDAADSGPPLVFKGGSSLTMAFRATSRLSEDVDLVLPPATLGFSAAELWDAANPTRRRKLTRAVDDACKSYLIEHFMPRLEAAVGSRLGTSDDGNPWLLFDDGESSPAPSVVFRFPSVQRGIISAGRNTIKLELGAGLDQEPTSLQSICPMIVEALPESIRDAKTRVVTLDLRRTFWEKATILHAEFHRPSHLPMPPRYSRHYSDFACLWGHGSRHAAVADLDMLARVCRHKSTFFPRTWASYGTAEPGLFRLVPPANRVDVLEHDYERLRDTLMGQVVPFHEILSQLTEAESELNGRRL